MSHITKGSTSLVAVAFLIFLAAAGCSSSPSFNGTVLDSSTPAPAFELRDQHDNLVTLSDLSGRVIVLTFLYTSCPDICPVVTETLRQTYGLLGDAAAQVEFVAITVDPERDSVERAYRYSQERDMLDKWHFLVGTRKQLEPLWAAYYVAAAPDRSHHAKDDDETFGEPENAGAIRVGVKAAFEEAAPFFTISHSAPVYLIDQLGYRRVIFTNLTLDPKPLVHDIQLLVKGAP